LKLKYTYAVSENCFIDARAWWERSGLLQN